MTDDTTPETTEDEQAPEAAAEEHPVAEEQAPEAAAEEAPAAEAEPPAPAPEPEEILSPKERRRRARAAKAAPTREPRTPEERHAERQAERKAKAVARSRRRGQEREKARAARAAAGDGAPTATPPAERVPGNPKVRLGLVVSDKADKTITVRVDTARRHRRYEKIVRSSVTLHAHDERNDAHEGDTVKVIECRPLSRTKRWRLVEVTERAK